MQKPLSLKKTIEMLHFIILDLDKKGFLWKRHSTFIKINLNFDEKS